MNPIFWLLAGGLGLFFAEKKAKAMTMGQPPGGGGNGGNPPTSITYGEPQAFTPFPSGFRRLKAGEVTADLIAKANAIRSSSGFTRLAYGTVIPIDGQTAALVEQHFHEPGGPVKPWGFHHGVTLITRA